MKRLLVVLVVLIVLAGAGLAVANFVLDRTHVTTRAVTEPVREIVVESDSGDIQLVAAEGKRVEVRETWHYVLTKPKVGVAVKNGVLTVDSDCDAKVLRCSADVRITVPAGVSVTAEADSGDVNARAISPRSAHLESDSGDVLADFVGRQSLVWAHTDSGRVDVIAAEARAVDAKSDSGDIAVDVFKRRPRRVVAHTDSGFVQVLVGRGEYAIKTKTDSGDVKVQGLIRNDRAPMSIEASSDSGDITLLRRAQ